MKFRKEGIIYQLIAFFGGYLAGFSILADVGLYLYIALIAMFYFGAWLWPSQSTIILTVMASILSPLLFLFTFNIAELHNSTSLSVLGLLSISSWIMGYFLIKRRKVFKKITSKHK